MKKFSLIAISALMVLSFAGCGTTSNNLAGTRRTDGTYYTSGTSTYWDGYGVNTGRTVGDDLAEVGHDLKNAAVDTKNGVERAVTGHTGSLAN